MYSCTRPLRSAVNTIERPSGANAIAVLLGRPCPTNESTTYPVRRRSAGATLITVRVTGRSTGFARAAIHTASAARATTAAAAMGKIQRVVREPEATGATVE